MAEYLIREESLVEIADAIRTHFGYYDDLILMITDRDALNNITIPDGATTIGNCAFWYCGSLTSVVVSSSVVNIDESAFSYCSKLTDIYLYPTTPPSLYDVSAISTATTAIHVPIGCGDAYKNATNWSSFADKIVEDIEI